MLVSKRTVETLEALGVDLVSVNDAGFDTSSPAGKLISHVLGSVAEFERGIPIERTRAGMAAARRRGKRIGRPTVRVDYLKLHRLTEEGASVSAMAKELGVSRTVVRRELAERGLSSKVFASGLESAAAAGTEASV